jgi:hypothetical protein
LFSFSFLIHFDPANKTKTETIEIKNTEDEDEYTSSKKAKEEFQKRVAGSFLLNNLSSLIFGLFSFLTIN